MSTRSERREKEDSKSTTGCEEKDGESARLHRIIGKGNLPLTQPLRLVRVIRARFLRNSYETGILGKWISCIAAQTMVKQLVSVVKASI